MSVVKDIKVLPIKSNIAREFIKKNHYSGKFVSNSTLHLGAFLNDKLRGVMSFGSPIDKRNSLNLVSGTKWHGMLELNRMAFDEILPKNSESRCIAIAMRLIKKNMPHIEWIQSFADATQCGDGTIYRASGFILTMIKTNKELFRLKDGTIIHKLSLHTVPNTPRKELNGRSYFDITKGKYSDVIYLKESGATRARGFQLRYIFFINKDAVKRLTVKQMPFSEIEKFGAKMYLGKRPLSKENVVTSFHEEERGEIPTNGLHFAEPISTNQS